MIFDAHTIIHQGTVCTVHLRREPAGDCSFTWHVDTYSDNQQVSTEQYYTYTDAWQEYQRLHLLWDPAMSTPATDIDA